MSCPYYDFKCNDFYCCKKEDYVNSDIYYKYCKNYSYDDCPIYKGESSSGCYLTTACIVAMGLEDNCHELTTLRTFRDTYMKQNENMIKDIEEYYLYAPFIVNKINKLAENTKIYTDIYINLVQYCVSLIEEKRNDEAYKRYKEYYFYLRDKYIG